MDPRGNAGVIIKTTGGIMICKHTPLFDHDGKRVWNCPYCHIDALELDLKNANQAIGEWAVQARLEYDKGRVNSSTDRT
jgi:hypothetical protein